VRAYLIVLSDIISNPHLERDMTDNFVCALYFKGNNNLDIRKNGVDPFVIWKILKYNAFDESVVSVILDRLILNNEKRKYIIYKTKTKKVLLTDKGRQWAEHNCRTRAGVIG
jgi:hypothetical protein